MSNSAVAPPPPTPPPRWTAAIVAATLVHLLAERAKAKRRDDERFFPRGLFTKLPRRLKNYHDLRSCPPVPEFVPSVWNVASELELLCKGRTTMECE